MVSQMPPKKLVPDGEEGEDRISTLPHDVLGAIISRLSMRDLVRTSALSRRWRRVYIFKREVVFSCSRMYGTSCRRYHIEPEELIGSQRKFVRAVDTFLQRHPGSKITSFELGCCFQGLIPGCFRRWMDCIGSLGTEHLILGSCCPFNRALEPGPPRAFSSDFLGEPTLVKSLRLKGISFEAQAPNTLSDLELSYVDVTAEAVECILLNCSSLQSLKLRSCDLPPKLCISGPDLRLKKLTVSRCLFVDEIDLSAMNLTTLELYNIQYVTVTFSNVPLLQNLFIEIPSRDGFTGAFRKLVEDLPHLKCMFFTYSAPCTEIFEVGEVNKLRHLRELALFLNYYNKLDLLELTTVLQACPLLRKFHLSKKKSLSASGYLAEKRVARRHLQLKELEFSGFNETKIECDFVLYILKNAVSLERLSIFMHYRTYGIHHGGWLPTEGNPRYSEKKQGIMRTWMLGHASSENIEITIG